MWLHMVQLLQQGTIKSGQSGGKDRWRARGERIQTRLSDGQPRVGRVRVVRVLSWTMRVPVNGLRWVDTLEDLHL